MDKKITKEEAFKIIFDKTTRYNLNKMSEEKLFELIAFLDKTFIANNYTLKKE